MAAPSDSESDGLGDSERASSELAPPAPDGASERALEVPPASDGERASELASQADAVQMPPPLPRRVAAVEAGARLSAQPPPEEDPSEEWQDIRPKVVAVGMTTDPFGRRTNNAKLLPGFVPETGEIRAAATVAEKSVLLLADCLLLVAQVTAQPIRALSDQDWLPVRTLVLWRKEDIVKFGEEDVPHTRALAASMRECEVFQTATPGKRVRVRDIYQVGVLLYDNDLALGPVLRRGEDNASVWDALTAARLFWCTSAASVHKLPCEHVDGRQGTSKAAARPRQEVCLHKIMQAPTDKSGRVCRHPTDQRVVKMPAVILPAGTHGEEDDDIAQSCCLQSEGPSAGFRKALKAFKTSTAPYDGHIPQQSASETHARNQLHQNGLILAQASMAEWRDKVRGSWPPTWPGEGLSSGQTAVISAPAAVCPAISAAASPAPAGPGARGCSPLAPSDVSSRTILFEKSVWPNHDDEDCDMAKWMALHQLQEDTLPALLASDKLGAQRLRAALLSWLGLKARKVEMYQPSVSDSVTCHTIPGLNRRAIIQWLHQAGAIDSVQFFYSQACRGDLKPASVLGGRSLRVQADISKAVPHTTVFGVQIRVKDLHSHPVDQLQLPCVAAPFCHENTGTHWAFSCSNPSNPCQGPCICYVMLEETRTQGDVVVRITGTLYRLGGARGDANPVPMDMNDGGVLTGFGQVADGSAGGGVVVSAVAHVLGELDAGLNSETAPSGWHQVPALVHYEPAPPPPLGSPPTSKRPRPPSALSLAKIRVGELKLKRRREADELRFKSNQDYERILEAARAEDLASKNRPPPLLET